MESNINFTTVTNFTGRNGYFKMIGINLLSVTNGVMLTAISTKGISRCGMVIPYNQIDTVITELRKLSTPEQEPNNSI